MIYATWTLAVITLAYVILIGITLCQTKRMAKATYVLAGSSLRPNLVIEVDDIEGKHWQQIRNTGAGPAIDVEVIIDETPVPDLPAVIPPGCLTGPIEPIWEAHGKHKVWVSCKDARGEVPKGYPVPFKWEGHRKQWIAAKPE